MTAKDHAAGKAPGPPRHELSDAPPRNAVLFTGGLVAALVASLWVTWWLFRVMAAATAPAGGMDTKRVRPPEPRLQERPAHDLLEIRAAEAERLSTYGWVDRQAGVAHIPIGRAMDLVVQEAAPR